MFESAMCSVEHGNGHCKGCEDVRLGPVHSLVGDEMRRECRPLCQAGSYGVVVGGGFSSLLKASLCQTRCSSDRWIEDLGPRIVLCSLLLGEG